MSLQSLSLTTVDPRADGARRHVDVSVSTVTIERRLHGVKMRIAVPISAYHGLVIAVRLPSARATLTLRHMDRDFDVTLADGDAMEVARIAKAWSDAAHQPIVIERAFIGMSDPIPRRTKRAAPKRRSRFARRRKVGDVGRSETVFAGEDEIIARS